MRAEPSIYYFVLDDIALHTVQKQFKPQEKLQAQID